MSSPFKAFEASLAAGITHQQLISDVEVLERTSPTRLSSIEDSNSRGPGVVTLKSYESPLSYQGDALIPAAMPPPPTTRPAVSESIAINPAVRRGNGVVFEVRDATEEILKTGSISSHEPPPAPVGREYDPKVLDKGTERFHLQETRAEAISAEIDRRMGQLHEEADIHKSERDVKARSLLERLEDWGEANQSDRQVQRNRHMLLTPQLAPDVQDDLPDPDVDVSQMTDVERLEHEANRLRQKVLRAIPSPEYPTECDCPITSTLFLYQSVSVSKADSCCFLSCCPQGSCDRRSKGNGRGSLHQDRMGSSKGEERSTSKATGRGLGAVQNSGTTGLAQSEIGG